MTYLLWVNQEAESEIRRLPGGVRQRIRKTIQQLRSQPRPPTSRHMEMDVGVPVEVRRIRLDQWRLVYVIDEELLEIGILAVRRRPPYNYEDMAELLANLS